MDNLESSTYEIFEKDPTKYTEYQKVYSFIVINDYWFVIDFGDYCT